MKNQENSQIEPYYYVGLVLKANEKQYLELIGYLNHSNSSKILYQRKSLTYLHIVPGDSGVDATEIITARGVMQ